MTKSEIVSTLTSCHSDTAHVRPRRNVSNSIWSLRKGSDNNARPPPTRRADLRERPLVSRGGRRWRARTAVADPVR